MIRDVSLPTTPIPEAARPAARPAAPAAEPACEPPGAPLPNPRLRIDPSLNLVVVEFRGAEGEMHTIPSAREMQAYRSGEAQPPGATPTLDVTR